MNYSYIILKLFKTTKIQILIYRTDYTIKQKRIKEFICNFIQHLSYMFGWSEGTIAFFVLLCYTIYIKGFCIKKGKNPKNR